MSQSLKVFESSNLPTPEALIGALGNLKDTCGSSGVAIMKYDKMGHFVYGQEMLGVEEGSTWAVNVFSFTHGYITWGGDKTPDAGKLLGETIMKMTETLPNPGEAPANCTAGWQKQIGFTMRCVSGDDEGQEVRFSTQSRGGLRAVGTLIAAIGAQTAKDPSRPIPIVRLVDYDPKNPETYYDHKNRSYGRVLVPVFEIVDWAGTPTSGAIAESTVVDAEVEVVTEADDNSQRRRRRRTEDDVAPF